MAYICNPYTPASYGAPSALARAWARSAACSAATQSQDTVLDRAFVPDELVAVVCPAGFAGAGLFQVQHHVAAMRMGYDAAEALLERTTADRAGGVGHEDWPVRIVGTRQVVINHAFEIVDRALDLSGDSAAFKANRLEQIFRDVRMGRFHPGNTLLAHELIGKLRLGIDPDDPQRWA
jgi:alkylation response protein AidB-like acyl-CoA dehydrogenase